MSSSIVQNLALLEALRTVVDLPESMISLKLTMAVEECPVIECEFHPVKDVTHLQSAAKEYVIERCATVVRRFELREIP